jgi:F-type H+-transporting ATPase subunit gamma
MASILSLKRRIQASKNVSKTTRAMQMIAASKMKKAQLAALSTRPYVEKLQSMTQHVGHAVGKEIKHPYLQPNSHADKTLLLVLSPDKGLCGGLITNLLKEFLQFTRHEEDLSYIVVGKKLESKIVHLSNEIIASFKFGASLPAFDSVYPIMQLINEQYESGKVSSVKILTTHFTSIFTQTPKITTLLPFSLPETDNTQKANDYYLFEPHAREMLPELLKHYVEMSLYQQMLESFVSEQAARMMAMQNATTNANDIMYTLKLEYNKTRQAKITGEILDITNGANA